jgi:hypothetical protein
MFVAILVDISTNVELFMAWLPGGWSRWCARVLKGEVTEMEKEGVPQSPPRQSRISSLQPRVFQFHFVPVQRLSPSKSAYWNILVWPQTPASISWVLELQACTRLRLIIVGRLNLASYHCEAQWPRLSYPRLWLLAPSPLTPSCILL